ncbi:hypothetical protein GobsT_09510 [Gemmata obscuriglobus]|uniref:hypothetical protein n=1 Tax=Gemmata obscuriglobus TaxID=114 RepID=UPI00016C369B|nr:hypothetical protein [Gemmata obscuriglobus]QEG26212.1 hypothetical protein GobsT_09510 [Gemmata obscuriglobus]VTS00925.1 Uncharacterized protein OS=Sorangium cellulosum (strain So ce56) GN=sce5710 PE=4 SV=1 [Gemmata obscuriglobus UQM 2246]
MTEAEWLACDNPEAMLQVLGTPSPRRMRLFACACCWRIASQLTEAGRRAIEAAERFADAGAAQDELRPVLVSFRSMELRNQGANLDTHLAVSDALDVRDGNRTAIWASRWAASGAADTPAEWKAQAALVRCIFRRAPPSPLDAAYRTDTVLALAAQMYESRDFSAMPILADALQDAGCDNADVLDHCRDPEGAHARGCWVVDLVLGKE